MQGMDGFGLVSLSLSLSVCLCVSSLSGACVDGAARRLRVPAKARYGCSIVVETVVFTSCQCLDFSQADLGAC